MDDLEMRRHIGDLVLVGDGFEFGAGLHPSQFAQVRSLTIIDKLTEEGFSHHFGQEAPYAIMTIADALATSTGRADFITAHQVVEHLANPIEVLASWLKLLKIGGTAFLSVPSPTNSCERDREPTPISHFLMDYINGADGTDFESRQHIPSFINQWARQNPEDVWYAQQDVQLFVNWVLIEQRRVEGHDLHWHTYTLETLRQVMEAAFYVAGMSASFTNEVETHEGLYCAAIRTAVSPTVPDFIVQYLNHLDSRLNRLRPPARSKPKCLQALGMRR